MEGTQILSPEEVNRKIERMAYQIWEKNFDESALVFVGIRENGLHFARALAEALKAISGIQIEVFGLKINKNNPLDQEIETDITEHLWKETNILIVDDVQNSGKTMIYALRHFLSYHLKSLQCAVLVDRSHNRFPVKADYIGLSLSTTLQEHVEVTHHQGKFIVKLI